MRERPGAGRAPGPGPRLDPGDRLPSPGDPFDAGPLPRLRAALHCPADARRLAWRRGCVAAAVAWLPLLALSTLQTATGPPPRHLFLHDLGAHARYLAAPVLLLAAEGWCLPLLATIVRHFTDSGLIANADRPRWQARVASARGMLDGRGVEVVLMVAAYLATAVLTGVVYPRLGSTWVNPAGSLSAAGWWRTLVSQPLFVLCSLAWIWRVLAWARLLWGASRLELRLVPSHPDRAAGLRFVGVSLHAFGPVALALGTVIAGTRAGEVLEHAQAAGGSGETEATMALAVGLALVLFAGPLLCFIRPLRRARLRGTLLYGTVAGGLGRRFEDRWLRPVHTIAADALEVQDFSATTDLYSVVANARAQAVFPVGAKELTALALWALLPFLPLALLGTSPGALLERAARLLL